MIIANSIQRLDRYLLEVPARLDILDETEQRFRPALNKWSKKEILGHLIDSAMTNLARFVKAQFESNPTVQYDQDQWCKYNYYQQGDFSQMILLWRSLNQQLVFIWRQLPSEALSRQANNHTLSFLAEDYIKHLEHHLNQIIETS